MAKRTRKNLSNPAVKRMTQKQGSSSSGKHRSPQNGGGGSVYSLLIFLLLCGITTILLYTNWDSLRAFGAEVTGQPIAEQPVTPAGLDDMESGRQPQGNDQPAATTTEEPVENPQPQPVTRRIQVEILNGCGVSGLAKQVTAFLRNKGIDVVSSGNFRHFNLQKTEVIDRTGNLEFPSKVANLLGIDASTVRTNKNSNLQLDATIVLGADYRNLTPFRR
ncbi:MAG: LytR C-terminal domain-containing protein [Calditrichia bacterium]